MFLSVRRMNDYSEIKVTHIEDLEQNKGPLMGIYSVMCVASYEKIWVTSCDMPFIDWQVAEELAVYFEDGIDAVIPVDRTGKKYVLCAWYRKSILEILKEQLESGDLKVKHLLRHLRVCYVAVEGLTDGSRKFQNINTRRLQNDQKSDWKKNCTQIFRLYLLLHIPAPVRRHFWRD